MLMFSKLRFSLEIQRQYLFSTRLSNGFYHCANGLKSVYNRFNNKAHDPGSLKMKKRKILLLSSCITKMNSNYLMYAQTEITEFLKKSHVIKVLFIPYALMDYDLYADKVRPTFNQFGFELESIHRHKNAERALVEADAIYIGGGNTFLLLRKLQEMNLIKPIRNLILIRGIPYLGSSAGTNVATVNICTTNDMPIVHPLSLNALNLIPFNINPHYVEIRKGDSHHTGETRDERIQQYLQLPGTPAVVGLREGAILKIEANSIVILGVNGARVFRAKSRPFDFSPGDDVSFLMEPSGLTSSQHRSYS